MGDETYTNLQLQATAEEAADKAICKAFGNLNVDIDDPLSRTRFIEDMRFIGAIRRAVHSGQTKAFVAGIVFLLTIVGALVIAGSLFIAKHFGAMGR